MQDPRVENVTRRLGGECAGDQAEAQALGGGAYLVKAVALSTTPDKILLRPAKLIRFVFPHHYGSVLEAAQYPPPPL